MFYLISQIPFSNISSKFIVLETSVRRRRLQFDVHRWTAWWWRTNVPGVSGNSFTCNSVFHSNLWNNDEINRKIMHLNRYQLLCYSQQDHRQPSTVPYCGVNISGILQYNFHRCSGMQLPAFGEFMLDQCPVSCSDNVPLLLE